MDYDPYAASPGAQILLAFRRKLVAVAVISICTVAVIYGYPVAVKSYMDRVQSNQVRMWA